MITKVQRQQAELHQQELQQLQQHHASNYDREYNSIDDWHGTPFRKEIFVNINIDSMPDTLKTVANKFRGLELNEIKQLEYRYDVEDLFIVLMGIFGVERAKKLYFRGY